MSLSSIMLDTLKEQGYNTLSALELVSAKMKEVATFPKGKHKIYIGNVEISFIKTK